MRKCWFQWVLPSMLMLGLLSTPSPGQTIQKGNDLVIGKIFNLSSKILGEERPIWVYLPPNYENSRESYPVFYLLDGELQFHHVTGIVEFLSFYSHMPRMILIAVTTVDRERDFLPTSVNNWPPVAAADKFHAFLKKELIPLVEKKYRTRPYRILCGHSYGGVFCIDAFLKDPDLFTAYIAISPTLSWDNQLLVKKGTRLLKETSFNNKFLFLTTSADDEGAIPPTRDFAALLEKNSPEGLQWRFDYMENDDHLSVVHPTIYNALIWLHQGWRIPERKLEEMTLARVKLHYEKLSRRYGSHVPVPEGVLFNLGYSTLDNGNKPGAVEVFKYIIELYPDVPSGYVGLGEAYEESGNLELAKKNYEYACESAKKNNDNMALPVARGLLERVLKKMKNK